MMEQWKADLHEYLEQLVALRRSMMPNGAGQRAVYLGKEEFLLRHGVWYEPTPYPPRIRRGMVKQCFWNSLVAAEKRGWKYVEGMAIAGGRLASIPLPLDHAWNVTQDGQLIDTTWANQGVAYVGVEFSPRRARHVFAGSEASILDNPCDGYALFHEPWQGEDFARKWTTKKRRLNHGRRKDVSLR